MLNTAGTPSRADCGRFGTVPLVQFRLTLTLDVLLSLKSLYTVNEFELTCLVLTMVQLPFSARFWQLDSVLSEPDGTEDSVVPFEHLSHYSRALPQAQVRELRGRDHYFEAGLPALAADIRSLTSPAV